MPLYASELRDYTDDELLAELDSSKEELFNLRFQKESGRLEDLSRIRALRRDAARILTVMRERVLLANMSAEDDQSE